MEKQEKKKFVMPDTYVIVFALIVLVCLLSYVIPAGSYDLVKGSRAIDPNSFHFLAQKPATLADFLNSFFDGLNQGRNTIFLVFLIGGAFQILMDTGSVDAILALTIKKTQGHYNLILPAVIIVMSFLGAVGVGNNVALAFVPILLVLASKLGLDAVVVAAILYLASNTGFSISPINPFTVLLGQDIAGVTQMSGILPRSLMWILFTATCVWYVLRYCKKIQADPSKSLTGILKVDAAEGDKIMEVKPSHLLCFAVLIVIFAVYAYGGIKYNWGLNSLGAAMIVLALFCGVIGRMSPNAMAVSFVKGAKTMVYSALLIGFAGSISVIMTRANIIHTVIYYMTLPLVEMPAAISAVGMFVVNFFFNFVTSSGSGQCYIVMPIMAPAADVLSFSRQIAVTAFQFGDGLGNVISPISGLMMGTIGMANVPFDRWLKFVIPFTIILAVFSSIFLVVATLVGWS
ncbi:MAG: hypothetical protein LBS70_03415 [Candidatus Accumulibacter sp.]|jgi:uncharacterized ion transporter superfamily protein YfcC|nr:hypothetical protein [Accumulibacter sp.]